MHSTIHVYGACAHSFCYSPSLIHCYVEQSSYGDRFVTSPKKVFALLQATLVRIPKHFTGYGYEEPPPFQNRPHHIKTRWPSTRTHASTHARTHARTHTHTRLPMYRILNTCTDHGLVQQVHIRSLTCKLKQDKLSKQVSMHNV